MKNKITSFKTWLENQLNRRDFLRAAGTSVLSGLLGKSSLQAETGIDLVQDFIALFKQYSDFKFKISILNAQYKVANLSPQDQKKNFDEALKMLVSTYVVAHKLKRTSFAISDNPEQLRKLQKAVELDSKLGNKIYIKDKTIDWGGNHFFGTNTNTGQSLLDDTLKTLVLNTPALFPKQDSYPLYIRDLRNTVEKQASQMLK